jgi:hypothetical protein
VSNFLNDGLLENFDQKQFRNNKPYAWFGFSDFLQPSAFPTLYDEFPAIDLFERHHNIERGHQQRPHNRYYLRLDSSIDSGKKPGVVGRNQLGPNWRSFISELESGTHYREFVSDLLEVNNPLLRFAWHIAGKGDDVSPHCDISIKAGSHLFYFNTAKDWKESWNGGTVLLEGKKNLTQNPEISDFEQSYVIKIIGNRSMLFQNSAEAWHSVDILRCPPEHYRRLFTVVVEKPIPHGWKKYQMKIARNKAIAKLLPGN